MLFMLSNDILCFYYVYFIISWEHTGILYWGSDVMAVSAVPSLTDIKTLQCLCHVVAVCLEKNYINFREPGALFDQYK